MADGRRHRIGSFAFTVILNLLVAFAITDIGSYFAAVLLGGIAIGAFFFMSIFPGSRFFSISLANSLAVYACLFTFFVTANFATVDRGVAALGFTVPLLALFLGCFLHREKIRGIVTERQMREEHEFPHVLRWLVPVALVGATTFVVPSLELDATALNIVFLIDMAIIGAVIFFVASEVASFLIDTGLLFESFFERVAMLAIPSFAFLTFYSLNVIVFAAIYRIADRLTAAPLFQINGEPVEISFVDAIYFSVISVSTVGYGDVIPLGDAVRVIASIQIVFGVLLLLFGFHGIMQYSRERYEEGNRLKATKRR
jgi:voltage-gated potassium channel